MKRFLRAYEDWIESDPDGARVSGPPVNYRSAIRREVARLASAVRRGVDWTPELVAA